MLKELLYVPNGSYVMFYINETQKNGNFEQFKTKWKMSEQNIIEAILKGTFKEEFYARNNLPKIEYLNDNHFEIINK